MKASLLHLGIFLLLFLPALLSMAQSGQTESQKLHELFELDWQRSLQESPEMATYLGDTRYNHLLTDLSPEAIKRRKEHEQNMFKQIQQIDKTKLTGQDILSYELFLRDKRMAVEAQQFPSELMPIEQMDGLQLMLGQLTGFLSMSNKKDYEDYLSRLRAYPVYTDQIIALLKQGIKTGWVQVALPLRSVPSQIEGQIKNNVKESVLYKPFLKFPASIPANDQVNFEGSATKILTDAVMPAYKKLLAFIKNEYLPACRTNIAVHSLPNGEAYYKLSIKRFTTTDLTAQQIHDLGKKEVARIRQEMEGIMQQTGFKGTFKEFLTFLRTDPQFYYTNPEALLAGYRDICKRIDAELPKLFAELPRLSYGVKAFPDFEAPAQTTARYYPGAADGSRPGYFMANTYKLETRPTYEMEALALHESVPGHHLQIARAQELKDLPQFRRMSNVTAFVEGWGLYAESLGKEMGFYTNPYSRFGQLTYEMWRACRLVVDTGMHSFGWSRKQAIDFMLENTAKSENDITVEIDRYIVWPGQALAYKVGELKIKEIRANAEKQMGANFDIRTFHNALLDDGSLPLDLLETKMNAWIRNNSKPAGSGIK